MCVIIFQIQNLQGLLELKNSDILHLQSQLIDKAGKQPSENPKRHDSIDSRDSLARTSTTAGGPLHVNITTHDARQPTLSAATIQSAEALQQRSSATGSFQQQLETMRQELKQIKESIGSQVAELCTNKNYPDIIRTYRSECIKLRKRVVESNNACNILRSRLEELAEFLEQILDMDERGLIDLSKLSGMTKEGLYKSLNDSRALSQTLSQSLLAGMDTLMEEDLLMELADETERSMLTEDTLYDLRGDLDLTVSDRTFASCAPRLSLLPVVDVSNLNLTEANYRQLTDKLCSDVQAKVQQLDDILVQVELRSSELDRKEENLHLIAATIEALKLQISQLEAENNNIKLRSDSDIVSSSDSSSSVDVAVQTLLAMAPRQSVSSLAELSTPYLSSCSESVMKNIQSTTHTAEDNAADRTSTTERQEEVKSCISADNQLRLVPAFEGQSTLSTATQQSINTKVCLVKLGLKSGCLSAGEAQTHPHHVAVSPSESEAWSEPDRNVSLARIGLETCTFAASLDRSSSRSRQTRTSAALSSESDTEECLVLPEDVPNTLLASPSNAGLVSLAANTKSLPKRKSDASEVRRLAAKLRTLEHLNETLKAELNIYQSLSHQLSPTTDQQQSDNKLSSRSSISGDIGDGPSFNTNFSGPRCNSVGKKLRRLPSGCEESLALAAPLLQEIRSLRSKLEESISNNDQLRDQLEAAVLSCSRASDDPSHLTHLTAALLNAQVTITYPPV